MNALKKTGFPVYQDFYVLDEKSHLMLGFHVNKYLLVGDDIATKGDLSIHRIDPEDSDKLPTGFYVTENIGQENIIDRRTAVLGGADRITIDQIP